MGVTSSTGKKGFNSTGEGVPTTFGGLVGNIGVTSSTSKKGQRELEPPWVKFVAVPPEFAADTVGGTSDGMSQVGPNTVVRVRTGQFDSDAFRWSRGFTSGKHSFEILFPDSERGIEASVGVGNPDAPLYSKGKVPVVGSTRDCWGFSLRRKRAFHKNAIVKKYPVTNINLPDRFYLHLDADSGSLSFGTDTEFYGTAFANIPRDKPLYPMVSTTCPNATITMLYRGQGNMAGPPPQVVQVVVVQQPTAPVAEEKPAAVESAPPAENAPPAESAQADPPAAEEKKEEEA